VRPNLTEFHERFDDLRCAYNAVAAVDALAAQIFVWAKANAPAWVRASKNDITYREELSKRSEAFAFIRDVAKAQKHAVLEWGQPKVRRSDEVISKPIGYGEGLYGCGRYGGPAQVVVRSEQRVYFMESILDAALTFLEKELGSISNTDKAP
jgi:hypothetical protein